MINVRSMLDQCHHSLTDFSLSNESRGEQLVGSRHSDTSTLRHRPTLRHFDTPTLSTLSTLYKEVHCQESPTLADTAPTPLRHCPDTARHPDTSVNRHCPDTAPTLPRHCPDTARHSDTPTLQGSRGCRTWAAKGVCTLALRLRGSLWLRGLSGGPLRGSWRAATRHKYQIPVQSSFMKPRKW